MSYAENVLPTLTLRALVKISDGILKYCFLFSPETGCCYGIQTSTRRVPFYLHTASPALPYVLCNFNVKQVGKY